MDNSDIFYPADETVDHLAVAQALAVKIRDMAMQLGGLTIEQQGQVEVWVAELGTAVADVQEAYASLQSAV
jgi:hypothetical protein